MYTFICYFDNNIWEMLFKYVLIFNIAVSVLMYFN